MADIKAIRKRHDESIKHWGHGWDSELKNSEVEHLLELLDKFGGHTAECAIWDYSSPSHRRQQGPSETCDCDWDEVRGG